VSGCFGGGGDKGGSVGTGTFCFKGLGMGADGGLLLVVFAVLGIGKWRGGS
jgi:hypothetical protein